MSQLFWSLSRRSALNESVPPSPSLLGVFCDNEDRFLTEINVEEDNSVKEIVNYFIYYVSPDLEIAFQHAKY